MLVRGAPTNLLKLIQGCGQVRRKITGFGEVRFLTNPNDSLFELIQVRSKGRFRLSQIRKLIENSGEQICSVSDVDGPLYQLKTRRAGSAILNRALPL